MRKLLPVPWIRWERFVIDGIVKERESGRPLTGLLVRAFDHDTYSEDDYLGEDETDTLGRFQIRFTDADFKDVFEAKPDLYLSITAEGFEEPLVDTSSDVRKDAGNEEFFEITIPKERLPKGV